MTHKVNSLLKSVQTDKNNFESVNFEYRKR